MVPILWPPTIKSRSANFILNMVLVDVNVITKHCLTKNIGWQNKSRIFTVASLQAPNDTGEEIRGSLFKISYACVYTKKPPPPITGNDGVFINQKNVLKQLRCVYGV
jgi:hypothetical protein